MPNDGIYLSNETYQKFLGDAFEQDSRSTIADEWQRQATAAIPSMVADAQDRQQQAAQSQRDALADQFTASVPDLVAQHVATLTPPESPQSAPSLTPPPEPSQSATVAPDTAPATGQAGVVDTAAPSVPTPQAAPTVSTPATPQAAPAPATGYEGMARAAAQKYGIDPDLFARQIGQESGFNPNALSPAGARGIAQFMPDTARSLGINPDDPEQALDGAARYMAQLIQHNGGDVSKALAAYNAGQGNVDKYGGIPPFEETKRYVTNIMSGAGQVAAGVGDAIANSGAGRVVTAAVNNVIGTLRPSQFGVGLSDGEAYAACGPVAAMAFARATGQNPTAEQAIVLAKQVGWTPAQGMAGPGSELDLLKNMGVAAHMEQGADPAKIAQDVQNGNPVIISTPGHYFVADGYDPQKGFHVGSSGTDLKAGSEWMSLDQMQRVMGAAQATLYLDRKPGDGPSVASQMVQQPTDQVAASTTPPAQPQQSMWDKLGSGISDVFKNIFGGVPGAGSGTGGTDYSTSPSPQDASQAGNVSQAVQDVGRVGAAAWPTVPHGAMSYGPTDTRTTPPEPSTITQVDQFRAQYFPSILDPNHPMNIMSDPNASQEQKDQAVMAIVMGVEGGGIGGGEAVGMLAKAQQAVDDLRARFPQMSEGSIAASGAGKALAALKSAAQQAELSAPANPFQLHTEPGPNRTLLSPDQAAQHLEDLTTRYQANDARVNQLEAQLHGGDLGQSTGVVRPPGTVGWTDAEVQAYAQLHGLNAYSTQGWGQQAGDAAYVAAHKPNVPNVPKQTPTQARAELAQLRAENEQISNAAEHAIDNGAGPLYRPEGPTTTDLPWDYNAPSGTATAPAENAAGAAARGSPADTGYAPQGTRTASPAGTPAAPAQPELAPPNPKYYPGTLEPITSSPRPPAATVRPTYGDEAMLEPEIAATLTPPAPREATDTLQGLLGMAKARGVDTSAFEAQLPKGELPETPAVSSPAATAPTSTGPLSLKPITAASTGATPPPTPPGPAAPTYPPPPPPPTGVAAAVGAVPPSPPTGGANGWDFLRALRTGSLAGGLPTMTHIILNSPLQTAWKLLGDVPTAVVTGHPETIPLEFMGAWQGLRGWASNAATTLTTPNTFGLAAKMGGGTGAQALETGLLGLVKTHPVIQDMARQLGTSMELWRQAGVEATNAGMARFSAPWWREVQRLVAQPTAAMSEAASATGETFALGGKMGKQGQALANWLNEDGNNIGHVIVPFYNIGYHVAAQGIERSPLGVLGTLADVAKMAVGKGPYAGGAVQEGVTPLALRIRNNAIGTGLAIEAFQQAALGNITGNGPDDPKLKADLLATGWQPDSIRVGGRYFGLHVLGPLGWPLATAANLYEATHAGDQGGYAKPKATTPEQFVDFASRMGQYGENETFLQGIAQILQGVGSSVQSGRIAEREAASMLTSLIPQGGLLSNAASIVDPNMRRLTPGDIGQAVENRLPIARQELPLKLTPTGQPMPNPQQGLGILLPRSSIANPDPVITAMGQAGIGAPTLPKTISVTSKYQMDLTPPEQQRFEELHGKALDDLLKEDVTDADWKTLSIDRQRQFIQRATAKATDVARKQLLDEMPDDQIESRLVLKTDAQAGNRVTVFGAP